VGRRIVHPPGLWPMHFGEAITVGKTVFAIFWAIIFDPTPSYANDWLVWNWTSLDQPCAGDCYGMAYAGRYVDNSMRNAFAIDEFRWPTQYDYGDSKFLGFAAGRRLATIGEALTIEPEIGLGRRFGADASTEAWAAMFLRWSWFPWNSVVRTSIAVSRA